MDSGYTETEMLNWRSDHEAKVALDETTRRVAIALATAYRNSIVSPGILEVAAYAGIATTAVGFIVTAPVTVPATVVSCVAITIAAYGLAGTTAYSLQSFSRIFPSISNSYTNMGEDFDRTYSLDNAPKSRIREIADHRASNYLIEKMLEKSTGRGIEGLPGLPDKDETDFFIELLQKPTPDTKPLENRNVPEIRPAPTDYFKQSPKQNSVPVPYGDKGGGKPDSPDIDTVWAGSDHTTDSGISNA